MISNSLLEAPTVFQLLIVFVVVLAVMLVLEHVITILLSVYKGPIKISKISLLPSLGRPFLCICVNVHVKLA